MTVNVRSIAEYMGNNVYFIPVLAFLSIYPSYVISKIVGQQIGFADVFLMSILFCMFYVLLVVLIEVNTRFKLYKSFVMSLNTPSVDISESYIVDGVNYTTALEKCTWSTSDLIRSFSAMVAVTIATSLGNWYSAIILLCVLLGMFLVVRRMLPKIREARYMLEKCARRIMTDVDECSKRIAYSVNEQINCEILQQLNLNVPGYVKYRKTITFYRSCISILSNLITFTIFAIGIYVLTQSQSVGVFIISVGYFSKNIVVQLVDSLVVYISESIHMKNVYEFGCSVTKIDRDMEEMLTDRRGSVLVFVQGSVGSGKSYLLMNMYKSDPNKVNYFDSKYCITFPHAVELINELRGDEILILDEAIYSGHVHDVVEYIETYSDKLFQINAMIYIVAHGYDFVESSISSIVSVNSSNKNVSKME